MFGTDLQIRYHSRMPLDSYNTLAVVRILHTLGLPGKSEGGTSGESKEGGNAFSIGFPRFS